MNNSISSIRGPWFLAEAWFCALTCSVAVHAQSMARPVTIRAADRGAPHLFLHDGRKVETNYSDSSFRSGNPRPLALASADFDEDGMPDLASGYAAADGSGAVTLHRGNVGALWPEGRAAGAAEPPAFRPDASVFRVPEAPDFLGAGDFNADGHWDLVAAHLGGTSLYLLRGDGHGGFSAAERIDLPGALTAFTTGEINRADGLTDIAVGVAGAGGAQVLVFESPSGALRGGPEVFPMAQSVAALVMMPLDDDPWNDLAVGAGDHLTVIHGRDRMLSGTKDMRAGAPSAKITRQQLPFAVRTLASGRFTSGITDLAALDDDGNVHFLERADADYQTALRAAPVTLAWRDGRRVRPSAAQLPKKPDSQGLVLRDAIALPSPAASRLVAAHTSIAQTDDLIVADGAASQLHVLSRTAGARAMHLAASLDTAGAPAAVLPMRLTPSSAHTLVVLHDGQAEPSVAVPAAPNVFTVTTTADPGPSDPSDDPSNINGPGSLRWALTNALNAIGPSLIDFNIPLSDANYNRQTGTFTFTPTPTTGCLQPFGPACHLLPYLAAGIVIDGYTQPVASPNTLTGGDNAVLKIVLNGVNATNIPVSALEAGYGLTTVRGLVINGFTGQVSGGITNQGAGIYENGIYNTFEGNFIGTDSTGTEAVPNAFGIGGGGGPNIVGGTLPEARNLLSGNGLGFAPYDAADPGTDFFQGNYVGTDRTGAAALPNEGGAELNGQRMVVGGGMAGSQNLISGNLIYGMQIAYLQNFQPNGNIVQGNLIGTDLTGTKAIPNAGGVTLAAGSNNLLGGTSPSARNVISGNAGDAVQAFNETALATIQGNYIGVDISGVKAMANAGNGINLSEIGGAANATGTLVGGDGPGTGNVIANSSSWGILGGGGSNYSGVLAQAATILGNLIGTDATGTNAMPNGLGGIELIENGSQYLIGGTDTPAGNTIAFNRGPGIQIDPGNNTSYTVGYNSVIGNAIFSNSGPGVWVHTGFYNKVSENSIYSNGGLGIDLNALGQLVNNSCPPATNGANDLLPAPVLTAEPGGATLISATATDPSGNTSEFSNCAAMTSTGNTLNIAGSFNGQKNTTYSIEFFQNDACDPSGYGQGKTFLNRISVTTGSNCAATISNNPDVSKADLAVTLKVSSTSNTVYFATSIAYVATVTNNGVAATANLSLSDTLPAGLILNSVVTTQGTCGNTGSGIACSLGSLASGATAVVTMNVTVNGSGTIDDTATVSSTTPDPNSANNTSSVSVPIYFEPVILSSLSPNTGIAGSGAITVTVYGYTLYPNVTTVTANGTPVNYTMGPSQPCEIGNTSITCQALNVTLPASLTASAGTLTIALTNPSPGGTTASMKFSLYVGPGTVTHFGLSCLPNPAVQNTAYNLTVTALDANGNIVPGYRGTIQLQDTWEDESFTPASPYTFTAADNGTHTFSTTFTRLPPEADVLTVSDTGTPSVLGTEPFNVVASLGAPASLSLAAAPPGIPIGFPFPNPVRATVRDSNNNPLPGISVSFSIAAGSNGASGTFSNGQTTIQAITDSNGTASATVTANQTAGSFTVTVTSGALPAQHLTLASNANVPAHIAIAFDNGHSGPIDTQFFQGIGVMVTDANNNPVPNIPVVFSAPVNGPSIYPQVTTVLTDNQTLLSEKPGLAGLQPVGMANSIPGNYAITATAGNVSVQFNFTNTSPAAVTASLYSDVGPQTAPINTPFAAALYVQPRAANGYCIAQVPITFSAPAAGPSATLSTTTVMSDPVNCTAQITATANGIAGGPYNVTATAPNGVSTTFSLTNAPGMSTLLATRGTPQTKGINQTFVELQATLLDGSGNPMVCQAVNFSAPASGASAALSPVLVLTDSSGNAQSSATANSIAGSYTVTATFGALTAPFALTNTAPTPSSVSATGGTPQSALIGTAFAVPLSATVQDSSGNPIAGVTLTFVMPTEGPSATLSSSTAVTNPQGVASVTATANETVGSYYAGAFVGLQRAAFVLANTAGSPARLVPSGTPQSTTPGAAFPAPLQVIVEDSGGNPLIGIPVTFSAPAAGASATLSASAAVSNEYGVASVTATANSTVGTYAVTAKSGSLTATFTLGNSPFSACDVNQDGKTNVQDVQKVVNEGLGKSQAGNDLNVDGVVNVVDVQIVINGALNLGCSGV